jgi:hypothetical protein
MFSELLTVAVIAAVCGVVWSDTLHITADNELKSVCVNGIDQGLGPNYKTVHRLDSMLLDNAWNANSVGCITVQAQNYKPLSRAGVLGCVTSNSEPTSLLWQCVSKVDLDSQTCCESCTSTTLWDTHSSNILHYLPNQGHNRNYIEKLPKDCKNRKGETEWVWDHKRKQPQVCCRAQPCAILCKGCEQTGPGACDPGMCMFGSTGITAPLTGPNSETYSVPQVTCNAQCCIEMTAHVADGTIPPTIKVTNGATGAVTYSHTSTGSAINFLLDLFTCSTYDTSVQTSVSNPNDVYQGNLNIWASAPANPYTGFVYVRAVSGGLFGTMFLDTIQLDVNGSPYFQLVPDPSDPALFAVYGAYSYASFCITGYPTGLTPVLSRLVIRP